jgi:hypothetical protein
MSSSKQAASLSLVRHNRGTHASSSKLVTTPETRKKKQQQQQQQQQKIGPKSEEIITHHAPKLK